MRDSDIPRLDDDDDDTYATADEGDDNEAGEESQVIGQDGRTDDEVLNQSSNPDDAVQDVGEWIHVTSNSDLPKINSNIECKFPDHPNNVKCTIISRAGKSSTASWHFLNIKEGDGEGKCCSFKNATWKPVAENQADETEPISHEVFYGGCDSAFDQAKEEEIEKWKLFKTFIEVPDEDQKTISTRWVCTRKIKGGKVVYKARLVARGFEEDSKFLRTDSPTCSKESLRLTLAIISCHSWKLHSLDVRSAFLQGTSLERNVFIKPPKEARSKFLWKMLKCPYGLADAGRLWYMKLKTELLKTGMILCKYDQALFTWFIDGKLSGVLAVHVDDILFGGEDTFYIQVISKLKSTFAVGLEEDTNLKYLGLQISQTKLGISVSTNCYANSLKSITVPENKSIGIDGFSSEETKLLKQFCGQINWLSTQGRPNIAFESCFVANSLKTGDPKIFDYANKVIRKTRNQNVILNYPRNFDIFSCCVVTFCDASFCNLPNGGSQGGYVSFIVDKNGVFSPVTWQSRKIRRVVKSTIGAECLAAVEAAEVTIFIATVIRDVLKLSSNIDSFLFCDNRNLVNAVHSSTNLEDKRLVLDVSILRDLVEQRELTEFLWIATDLQLADVLTKQGASSKLLLNVLNNDSLRFHKSSGSFR